MSIINDLLLSDHCIICGISTKRTCFHLDARITDLRIVCCEELSLSVRCNTHDIAGSKLNFFTVNYSFSFAGENNVNLFIALMRMDKRDTCACRKMIDTDLRSCESKLIMKFCSGIICNTYFTIICHF